MSLAIVLILFVISTDTRILLSGGDINRYAVEQLLACYLRPVKESKGVNERSYLWIHMMPRGVGDSHLHQGPYEGNAITPDDAFHHFFTSHTTRFSLYMAINSPLRNEKKQSLREKSTESWTSMLLPWNEHVRPVKASVLFAHSAFSPSCQLWARDSHLMVRVPERAHGYQSLGGSGSHQSGDIIEKFKISQKAKRRVQVSLEAINRWIKSGEKQRSTKNLTDKERGSWRRITAPGSAIRGFEAALSSDSEFASNSMGRAKAKKQQATVHRCEYRNLMERGQARTRRGKRRNTGKTMIFFQDTTYQLIDNVDQGLMVVGNKARGSFIPTMIDERNEHTIPSVPICHIRMRRGNLPKFREAPLGP
ncbi:hypothetical protein EV421DRAFT_1733480 [Armillaria borealis]|uniref:Uncharacterized protein n=1 Tax=Armillaria borealis TaxID=47425 RepID=A0AA39JUD1_9AGAR|nr:hypothetical protein EV421DRAFT_1733480 [Armillaria borealis]